MSNRSLVTLAFLGMMLVPNAHAAERGCPRAHPAPGLTLSIGVAFELFGRIRQYRDPWLTVANRDGKPLMIDASPALKAEESTMLLPGRAVDILGTRDATGVMRADVIRRAKGVPTVWPSDCGPVQ